MGFTSNLSGDQEAQVRAAAQGQPSQQADTIGVSQAKSGNKPFSFIGSRSLSRGMSVNMGSERANKALKALETGVTTINATFPELEVATILLTEEENPRISIPAVVFCMREASGRDTPVVAHTLIIRNEQSPGVERDRSRPVNINGENLTKFITPMDCWDSVMAEVVQAAVMRKYPNQAVRLAHASVLPLTLDLADAESVHRLVVHCYQAVIPLFNDKYDAVGPMNLAAAAAAGPDSELRIKAIFNGDQEFDILGVPHRADIQVVTESTMIQKQTAGVTYQEGAQMRQNEAMVCGYMDFVYDPVVSRENPYYNPSTAQLPNGMLPSMTYTAKLVITMLWGTEQKNLQKQLLGLYSAMYVLADNKWRRQFDAKQYNAAKRSNNLSDVGALNIEVGFGSDQNQQQNMFGLVPSARLGAPIDTDETKFNQASLDAFLNMSVRPGVVVVMDVERAGAQTPSSVIFNEVALGREGAIARLTGALNEMTGGRFSTEFQNAGGREMIVTEDSVFLGRYRGTNGDRDIRDVDYLALLNHIGRTDYEGLRRKMIGAQQTQHPLVRDNRRLNLIRETATTMVLDGTATRLLFTPQFMTALKASIDATGFPVITDYNNFDNSIESRAQYRFASMAINSANVAFTNRNTNSQGFVNAPMQYVAAGF
ncbi:MAG: hypothetical protein E6Q68_07560 [Polynucleobacter sp.]|nr:MAG: hypothetical protein E6Q68_07560 [Polynucleobacter sp.]